MQINTFRLACFPIASLIVFLLPFPLLPLAAEEQASPSLAVIAATPADQGIADLMVAKLSEVDGLRLVERSAIAKLLNELKLDAVGLWDPQNATRFGKLATADAILIVEDVKAARSLRARLIESRSGIRWADELTSPGDAEIQCAEIARRIPVLRDNLHLAIVGMLGSARRPTNTDAGPVWTGPSKRQAGCRRGARGTRDMVKRIDAGRCKRQRFMLRNFPIFGGSVA